MESSRPFAMWRILPSLIGKCECSDSNERSPWKSINGLQAASAAAARKARSPLICRQWNGYNDSQEGIKADTEVAEVYWRVCLQFHHARGAAPQKTVRSEHSTRCYSPLIVRMLHFTRWCSHIGLINQKHLQRKDIICPKFTASCLNTYLTLC